MQRWYGIVSLSFQVNVSPSIYRSLMDSIPPKVRGKSWCLPQHYFYMTPVCHRTMKMIAINNISKIKTKSPQRTSFVRWLRNHIFLWAFLVITANLLAWKKKKKEDLNKMIYFHTDKISGCLFHVLLSTEEIKSIFLICTCNGTNLSIVKFSSNMEYEVPLNKIPSHALFDYSQCH